MARQARREGGRLIASTPARSPSSSPARPPSQGLPFVPAAGFVLVWSSGYIAGPYGVEAVSPLCLVAGRFVLAAVLAGLLAWALRRTPAGHPRRRRPDRPRGVRAQRRPVRRDVPRLRRRARGHARLADALAQPGAHRPARRGVPARATDACARCSGSSSGWSACMLVLGPGRRGGRRHRGHRCGVIERPRPELRDPRPALDRPRARPVWSATIQFGVSAPPLRCWRWSSRARTWSATRAAGDRRPGLPRGRELDPRPGAARHPGARPRRRGRRRASSS